MINTIMKISIKMKGKTAPTISLMVVPGGATPFITNRRKPNGGVSWPMTRLMTNMMPNHKVSTFNALRTGKNIGMVSIMMGIAPMKQPKIKTTICMRITRMMGGKGRCAA